jgi:hypothetical protein
MNRIGYETYKKMKLSKKEFLDILKDKRACTDTDGKRKYIVSF